MPPRRVVRTSSEKSPEPTLKKPLLMAFWKYFCYAIRLIWSCAKSIWYWIERIALVLLMVTLTAWLAWWLSREPSNLRDWLPAESILPEVSFSGNIVAIKSVRNHLWTTDKNFTPGYYDATYNLDEIEGVHYIITPFSDYDGPAHTMLSFTFSGGQHVVVSAEVRKERGEDFDAVKGILNQYELLYVIADENDVIRLRTNFRKNSVYMYPIKVEKEKIQSLFRTMLIRSEKLRQEPEFYNTLWNNCTTSILMHANALRTEKLSWGMYTLLPSHSDELVYSAGLIDTSLSLAEARDYYMISDVAQSVSGEASFSHVIRREKK